MIKLLIMLLLSSQLIAQTLDEKKASLRAQEEGLGAKLEEQLQLTNTDLLSLKKSLNECYEQAHALFEKNADPASYQALLDEITSIRQNIAHEEELWQEVALEEPEDDSHALWHQPETTLGQLVIDYGASYVYLIPQELASMPLSIASHLPIPLQSWDQMLEEIITSLGASINQLNPYLRQICSPKEFSAATLSLITDKEEELNVLPTYSKVCFILSPTHADPKEIFSFFERFANPERIRLNMIGREIFVIATVQEVKQLLKMHGFIDSIPSGKEYRLVSLSRIPAVEAEKMLLTYFTKEDDKKDRSFDLKVLSINASSSSLFLVGTKNQIQEALIMLEDIEEKMQDPKEKVLFCYTCKNSKAEEVAAVLEQVYALMQGEKPQAIVEKSSTEDESAPTHTNEPSKSGFIVDSKNGSIVMVVEKEALEKLQNLLKKIDIPKKMVRIEVLLFEKKVSAEDRFGLNLLKVGSKACQNNLTDLGWNSQDGHGILSFFLSRSASHGIPAFDMAYNFLISQEDVQINACPSVTTVNQTPAQISLVEEISVSNGTVILEGDNSGSALKDSFSRAQYGIIIDITPTVHLENEDDEGRFITLETDITFDTTKPSKDNRPDVTKRNIKNQVRIPDGETVILGGLRRKTSHDSKDSIPFLGEIPGFGKLFSETSLSDSQTEMFIFLTPKIIDDNPCDLERATREELSKRPGDLPELLQCLQEAKENEWNHLFEGSLKLLFGRDACGCS